MDPLSKNYIQIFDSLCINKNIEQNVKEDMLGTKFSCICQWKINHSESTSIMTEEITIALRYHSFSGQIDVIRMPLSLAF